MKYAATITIALTVLVLGTAPITMAGTWTTLDRPGGTHTWAYGIDGNNIVGGSSTGSYLYNGSTWTTIYTYNYASDIDGNNIVINSFDLGSYLYNVTSSTMTPLRMPGAYRTDAYGIDGNNIVGGSTIGAFLYNGATWTILDMPGANGTWAYGIDGDSIVGSYFDGSSYHGFLYDGSEWTALDMPGADGTAAYGIDGSNIVGRYWDDSGSYGFLYDGSTWITLDMPGGFPTFARGIDGDRIVGYYTGAGGIERGFIYTIPEPSAILLLSLGAGLMVRMRRSRTFQKRRI